MRIRRFSQSRWGFPIVGIALGIGAAALWAGNARPTARPSVGVRSSLCRMRSPAEWQTFLEDAARDPRWVETCEDSPCDGRFYARVRDEIFASLQSCLPEITADPRLAACTANLRRFVPAWMRQHDQTSYGFNVDNREYFRQQETPDKPLGMMVPPEEIISALPDRGRVEATARRLGLKYLTHDSALGGIRTFVLTSDPAGRWDQWLLLNLQSGKSQVTESTPVSVLTVQKADATGNPLPKVRVNFRDYFVHHQPNGAYRIELRLDANGKCYSCHANGVRQLIARRTPTLEARPVAGETDFAGRLLAADAPDFGYRRLMEFNKRLRSYGNPDWDGKIEPADFGPALGRAQHCTDCHDGKSRGTLTVATSPAQLKQKVIDELSMPPDTDEPQLLERVEMHRPRLPTAREKQELERVFAAHESLSDEFMSSRPGELKAWMLAVPCR